MPPGSSGLPVPGYEIKVLARSDVFNWKAGVGGGSVLSHIQINILLILMKHHHGKSICKPPFTGKGCIEMIFSYSSSAV